MKKYRFIFLALLLSLALLVTACTSETAESELESILVQPPSTSREVGDTQQYMAIGAYADGSTATITGDVDWESSDTAVATIDTGGRATAVAVGSTTITATLGGISGEATLTVTEPAEVTLESISVTPASASKEVGQTQQYTATGTYSDGSTPDITAEVSWDSSATGVATISSAGLAAAVSIGSTNITATLDTVSGTATLTVTEPSAAPPDIPAPHLPAGCSGCHAEGYSGAPQWPDNHAGFTDYTLEDCRLCHGVAGS